MKQLQHLSYSSCTSQLGEIRKDVRAASEAQGFNESDINLIVLAVDEAYANVIRYGYNMCDDGSMDLKIFDDGDEIVFHLADRCPKICDADITAKPREADKPGGLGLHIINEVMDGGVQLLETDEPGNTLELRKRKPVAPL